MTLLSRRSVLGFGVLLFPNALVAQGLSLPGVEPPPTPAPSPGGSGQGAASYPWKPPPVGLAWTVRFNMSEADPDYPDMFYRYRVLESGGDWVTSEYTTDDGQYLRYRNYRNLVEASSANREGFSSTDTFDAGKLASFWPLQIGKTAQLSAVRRTTNDNSRIDTHYSFRVVDIGQRDVGPWSGVAATVAIVINGVAHLTHLVDVATGTVVKGSRSQNDYSYSYELIEWRT